MADDIRQRAKRYGHTVNIHLTDNTIIIISCTINTFKSRFISHSPLSLTASTANPYRTSALHRPSRRTAPKFGTHVQIDTLTLKQQQNLTHPTLGGFRGLSIVKNLSRRTAPKFGTHVRIDTLTLKKNLTHPTPGGLTLTFQIVVHIRLFIFRNIAVLCGPMRSY